MLSRELLESACDRPKNHFHYGGITDVVLLGCSLFFAVGRAHAFLQGNKRTALKSMIAFYGANGFGFEISDHMPNGDYLVAAIEGSMTDNEFIEAIRPGVCPL